MYSSTSSTRHFMTDILTVLACHADSVFIYTAVNLLIVLFTSLYCCTVKLNFIRIIIRIDAT
jgi:hypothetical protein